MNLTWHSVTRRLVCHHCGYTRALDDACPECGGLLNQFGTGTQKLEEHLRAAAKLAALCALSDEELFDLYKTIREEETR